jgi:hypothetical protein
MLRHSAGTRAPRNRAYRCPRGRTRGPPACNACSRPRLPPTPPHPPPSTPRSHTNALESRARFPCVLPDRSRRPLSIHAGTMSAAGPLEFIVLGSAILSALADVCGAGGQVGVTVWRARGAWWRAAAEWRIPPSPPPPAPLPAGFQLCHLHAGAGEPVPAQCARGDGGAGVGGPHAAAGHRVVRRVWQRTRRGRAGEGLGWGGGEEGQGSCNRPPPFPPGARRGRCSPSSTCW